MSIPAKVFCVVTQVPREGLTSVEQSLVEHVGRGEWLDLRDKGETVDEASMRSWGDSRTCRASVIRDILRGRLAANPDPHGLRLRGVRITGRLDLENLVTDVSLELKDCLLKEGLNARDARLAVVDLAGCQIEHPAEPPLDLARLTCSVLGLDRARVNGHTDTDVGAVNLLGAHIGGNLVCDGAQLRNDSAPALLADGLQLGRDMFLRERFTATGAGGGGTIRLTGAHIGGSLLFNEATLRNDSGPALVAYGLQVGQSVFLRSGFTAIGTGERGAVRLIGAHIRGHLDCTKAELRNDSGPALRADSLQIDQDMLLTGGFTVTGGGEDGALRLPGARIGGSLECDGAQLRNDSGPALYADRLHVDQSMFVRYGFTAAGSSGYGTVYLVGAHIGGHLDCTKADLRNDCGPALAAYSLQVGQGMYFGGGFTATGAGEGVAVDLTDAQAGGKFVFAPGRLEHKSDPHQRLAVDGLTYAGVPDTGLAESWLELLRDGTPRYAAQPYQQLAAGYRARGDDRQARRTLMAQRDDQLARTGTRWPERLWGRITKVTLGYGYQPWRALLFLAAVVLVSCVLAVVLGAHGALAQTSKTATPGRSCTVVQQVSVGLDLNLPVGTSVARATCDLTTDSASVTAAWLTAVGWVLRLLAWVFAALFIAGFTSAVRKT
jgi:hypothetical protein